jgi:hypothetical protein
MLYAQELMLIGSLKLCLGSQGGNKFNSKYDFKNSMGQMLIMYTRVDFNIETMEKSCQNHVCTAFNHTQPLPLPDQR